MEKLKTIIHDREVLYDLLNTEPLRTEEEDTILAQVKVELEELHQIWAKLYPPDTTIYN